MSCLFMFRYDYIYVRSVLVKNKVKLLEAALKYVAQPTPRPLPSPIFSTLHISLKKETKHVV